MATLTAASSLPHPDPGNVDIPSQRASLKLPSLLFCHATFQVSTFNLPLSLCIACLVLLDRSGVDLATRIRGTMRHRFDGLDANRFSLTHMEVATSVVNGKRMYIDSLRGGKVYRYG